MISIITPVFNAEKYLQPAFEAIKAQTYSDWEWIVTDDCSHDQSLKILEQIAAQDSRVRVFKNLMNSGTSVARNNGLDQARGDYVAFLDADDLWLPTKLARQLQFMEEKKITFSCHNYEIMNEAGGFIKHVKIPELVTSYDLEAYNPLATSFVMIHREIIKDLRFDSSLRRRQDWVFWFQLIKGKRFCFTLQENLGRYRKDSVNSISKNKVHMAAIQWTMYRRYFQLGFLKSIQSFIRYAVYGVMKHYVR